MSPIGQTSKDTPHAPDYQNRNGTLRSFFTIEHYIKKQQASTLTPTPPHRRRPHHSCCLPNPLAAMRLSLPSSNPTITLLLSLVLSLTLLFPTVTALKQPTSYCKCICFQNSTIIPLNSPPTTSSSAVSHNALLFPRSSVAEDDSGDTEKGNDGKKKHRDLSCNDCNRAFCLDYNLPICKNAKEEDVFATCFRMFYFVHPDGFPPSCMLFVPRVS